MVDDENAINNSRLIIVEGKAEIKIFTALGYAMNISDFQIRDINGISNYKSKISAITKTQGFSGVTRLGLVRDADRDPKATLQSMRNTLKVCGLEAPKTSLQPVGTKPEICVLILPDDKRQGMLEDICLESVQEDLVMRCVNEYLKCIVNNDAMYSRNESKTKLHAFLASREKPDLTIGYAAMAGYFPFDHPSFDRMKQFLSWISS